MVARSFQPISFTVLLQFELINVQVKIRQVFSEAHSQFIYRHRNYYMILSWFVIIGNMHDDVSMVENDILQHQQSK